MAIKELLNESAYNEAADNTRCVVQFTASWCGPCKNIKPVIDGFSSEFGFDYYTVDIDKNREFAMSKGIRSVPYVEIFSSGELKDSFVGGKTPSQLSEYFSVHFGDGALND